VKNKFSPIFHIDAEGYSEENEDGKSDCEDLKSLLPDKFNIGGTTYKKAIITLGSGESNAFHFVSLISTGEGWAYYDGLMPNYPPKICKEIKSLYKDYKPVAVDYFAEID
jgi:hypothetical protein